MAPCLGLSWFHFGLAWGVFRRKGFVALSHRHPPQVSCVLGSWSLLRSSLQLGALTSEGLLLQLAVQLLPDNRLPAAIGTSEPVLSTHSSS